MPSTNVSLSEEEQMLVRDTNFLLKKRDIINKVYDLFADLAKEIDNNERLNSLLAEYEVEKSVPKISKGENYLGLPYVVLDHPKVFNEIHIFSIRTFFWWGNFFSISIHLAGGFKVLFERKLKQKKIMLPEDIFICIHEAPWQYHFESDNYISAQGKSSEELTEFMVQKEFIKMAFKLDISHWNEAGDWCVRKYDEIGLLLD